MNLLAFFVECFGRILVMNKSTFNVKCTEQSHSDSKIKRNGHVKEVNEQVLQMTRYRDVNVKERKFIGIVILRLYNISE